jgi:hypothetical protein
LKKTSELVAFAIPDFLSVIPDFFIRHRELVLSAIANLLNLSPRTCFLCHPGLDPGSSAFKGDGPRVFARGDRGDDSTASGWNNSLWPDQLAIAA